MSSAAGVEGRSWTVAGLVCAILGLIIFPIILGPLGAIFGFVGHSKGDPKGRWVGIGGIASTILGTALVVALMA